MGLGKPMSKWAMQETLGTTVADSIGGNAGTATSGNARRFNGTSDYVSFANQIIPLGAKTIKFKFRKNGNPSAVSFILDNCEGGGNNNGTVIYLNADGTLTFANTKNNFGLTSPTNICDNKWHEIMCTWDGTTNANVVKVYVDDMNTPTVTGTALVTETTASTYNLRLAASASAANSKGAFDIDDLQITNAAMGAGTVVAWWKMDDAAATAMVDSSTNAYVATITGTTVITDSMPIIVSDGAGGYCRRFNGRSDRITFSGPIIPLGAKSVRFKMRKLGAAANNQYIMDNHDGGTGTAGFSIYFNNSNRLNVECYSKLNTIAFYFNYTSATLFDGNWHEVLVTWDGTLSTNGVKLFIDDMVTPQAQYTATSLETTVAANNLTIGDLAVTKGAAVFQGDLKDIQINVGAGTERTDPKDLQIGDFIAASYVAASGSFGTFINLGISPTSYIPAASSAAPNGGFYLMYVGDDFAGRKILISDRNIQHSIAWDALNTAGVAAGSGLPIPSTNPDAKIKLTNPAALPANTATGAAFSADGVYMSVGHGSTPFVTIYKRSGDTFTKLADPAALPTGTGNAVAFSADGVYMSVAHITTPYVTIYKRSGDTFTKLANPATLPASTATGVAFSADGMYMSVAHAATPFVTIYKRSGDTFTKLADPAALPAGTGNAVAFSADGMYMSVSHATTPFITIYKRSGDTFTKLADPATLPAGNGTGVAFSADGTYMSVAHYTTPFVTIYKCSGDTFTKLANPATLPANTATGAAFSADGVYMSVAHATTPFVTIYKRSGDTFTKLANPTALPASTGNAVAFSADGVYMSVAHSTTPFVTIYKTATLYATNAYGFTARLLTGGISATDTDNEWDNYIVNSTLNGTIAAANNNVWNWSGILSRASTAISATPGNRVIRGNASASDWTNGTTANTATSYGFRPVLLIESLVAPFVQKYLFQDGTDIKKYANSAWSIVGVAPVTEAMFTTDGMTDLVSAIAAVNLLTSRTPKVFSLAQAVKQAKLTALPPDKLILPMGDIDLTNVEGIDAVTLTANQSGAGKVRVIVSTDGGSSWRAWSTVTSSWVSVPPTAAAASTNGMTAAVLNARTRADWDALFSGVMNRIRFGYLLSLATSTDVANTDLITAVFDMRGSWDRASHGTDYVFGYVANTLLRVKLLSNGDFKINY